MASPKINFAERIARIPEHVGDMPAEAASPIDHYERGANDSWNLLRYFARTAERAQVQKQAFEGHLLRLRSMVLLALIETFERFLKELAAACVDQLAGIVLDDRLSVLSVHPRAVAAHFDEATIGKALCEAETWLDSTSINTRFGRLLADPFKDPTFKFFPTDRKDADFWRRGTMDILWQLRHSIAHNAGVITRSDAAKLRLLRRGPVTAPKVLQPTNGDIWYVKLFLDDLARWSNARVAERLVEVLTLLYTDDPSLFSPQERAEAVAKIFRVPVTIAGAVGAP